MGEQPTPEALVARSSRFVVRLPDNTVLHGVQFPSGRVIADDPVTGLIAAESTEHLLGTQDAGRVEWVPEPSAIEQRLRAFVAELELAERADQAPLPYDLLIATLQSRVLDPRVLDSSGPERMGSDPVRCAICTHPAGDHSAPRGREPFCHACEPPAWNHAMTTDPKEASA